jgi:undecaprenyl-diphosphatase
MSWLDALILGIVEGVTEFLPVSSTGHLIIARSLLGLSGASVDRMLIVIQGAAILAVCWEYRSRLWDTVRFLPRERRAQLFVLNLLIAFLPLAILGLVFEEPIDRVLFHPIPVACALIVGGILILWAERRKHEERLQDVDAVRPSDAVKLGFLQALALFPGTSRAAATILGGLLIGMSRRVATEFSFFLAIPTLLAATVYKLWQAREEMVMEETSSLLIASVAAFISALIAVRVLLRIVSKYSFASFAYYRIVFGLVILGTWISGLIHW